MPPGGGGSSTKNPFSRVDHGGPTRAPTVARKSRPEAETICPGGTGNTVRKPRREAMAAAAGDATTGMSLGRACSRGRGGGELLFDGARGGIDHFLMQAWGCTRNVGSCVWSGRPCSGLDSGLNPWLRKGPTQDVGLTCVNRMTVAPAAADIRSVDPSAAMDGD